MADIRPIETFYKGYRFRSRLEARWAVFFDALNLDWEYEPQGYEADSPRGRVLYLADFKLPELQCWAEVKGTTSLLLDDCHRIGHVVPHMPYIEEGVYPGQTNARCGLLILGPIPEDGWGPVFHPFLCLKYFTPNPLEDATTRLEMRRAFFGPNCAWLINQKDPLTACIANPCLHSIDIDPYKPAGWSVEGLRMNSPYGWYNKVRDAYTAARQARFEHGESGLRSIGS